VDLFNSPSTLALDRHGGAPSREECLVLQLSHSDSLWGIDESCDIEEICFFVDFWNTAVISDEVIFISGDGCLDQTFLLIVKLMYYNTRNGRAYPRRLAIVREL
jgi:hypothetical protein